MAGSKFLNFFSFSRKLCKSVDYIDKSGKIARITHLKGIYGFSRCALTTKAFQNQVLVESIRTPWEKNNCESATFDLTENIDQIVNPTGLSVPDFLEVISKT